MMMHQKETQTEKDLIKSAFGEPDAIDPTAMVEELEMGYMRLEADDSEEEELEEDFMEEEEEIIPITYSGLLRDVQDQLFGQDKELEKIIYDIATYIRSYQEDGPVVRHNFLLAGPSASGKTELYRVLKRWLKQKHINIPVIQIDVTSITKAGFQGNDASMIPKEIFYAGSDGGYAIVFLDEIDKILMPSFDGHGQNFNAATQHDLLTLIEGQEVNMKTGRTDIGKIDTSKTLFIGIGAFTDFRVKRAKKKQDKVMGFVKPPTEEVISYEEPLKIDDLISVGGQIELIGRFDTLYNFKRIDEISFSLLYEKLLEDLSIEQKVMIVSDDDAEDEFFELCKSEFGIREIKRKLYNTIRPVLMSIAELDVYERINIRIVVEGIDKASMYDTREE